MTSDAGRKRALLLHNADGRRSDAVVDSGYSNDPNYYPRKEPWRIAKEVNFDVATSVEYHGNLESRSCGDERDMATNHDVPTEFAIRPSIGTEKYSDEHWEDSHGNSEVPTGVTKYYT